MKLTLIRYVKIALSAYGQCGIRLATNEPERSEMGRLDTGCRFHMDGFRPGHGPAVRGRRPAIQYYAGVFGGVSSDSGSFAPCSGGATCRVRPLLRYVCGAGGGAFSGLEFAVVESLDRSSCKTLCFGRPDRSGYRLGRRYRWIMDQHAVEQGAYGRRVWLRGRVFSCVRRDLAYGSPGR